MFGRAIRALESIAADLRIMRQEMQSMRQEQLNLIELSRTEASKGPSRILEVFEQVKGFLEEGGKRNGQ
jgi:hypothetical protein